jgi:choline dehydrogenase-like flavoprotein
MNGASKYGVGSYQLTVRNGPRSSAAVTFLLPIRRRPNLIVMVDTHVTRVRRALAHRHHLDSATRMGFLTPLPFILVAKGAALP